MATTSGSENQQPQRTTTLGLEEPEIAPGKSAKGQMQQDVNEKGQRQKQNTKESSSVSSSETSYQVWEGKNLGHWKIDKRKRKGLQTQAWHELVDL